MSKNDLYVKLKDISTVNQGLQIPISKRYRENGENRYFYITIQFLKDGFKNKFFVKNPPKSSICNEDDILVVRTGSTGKIITGVKGCFHNNFFKVNYDKNKVIDKFLYYCLTTKEKQSEMLNRSGLTTIPDLNHFMFLDMEIPLPSIQDQQKITHFLSVIDEKIEIGDRINQELEKLAKTIYDYWFIQFDFPDDNGKPYKSSGGEMVYNAELKRDIPKDWEVKKLRDLVAIHDSKRIPLSKQQRELIQGEIPYYGATCAMDYINDYIFDGIYILLAEDGSVMDTEGKPILQYIWGKTWVNNHAHVLEGINEFSNEFLHLMLKNISVVKIMTGSIQKKINQENLLNTLILIPPKYLLIKFQQLIKPIYQKKIIIFEENQKLKELRDWLLPMLMNGQVKVE